MIEGGETPPSVGVASLVHAPLGLEPVVLIAAVISAARLVDQRTPPPRFLPLLVAAWMVSG